MKKVLFILGPTGVGKSEMAIKIAQKFGGEIISADSVQVFRQLDIGSAKITKEEMQNIPHYGIDILNPNDEFSVFNYVEYTKKKIEGISSRGRLPIIVGGTGLYVKALTLGYDFGGAGKNADERDRLKKEAEEKGLDVLYERLKQVAPQKTEKIFPNDEKRIIRALEIYECGEEPSLNEVDIDAKIIALDLQRDLLYDRINKRVDKMLDNGLLHEVETLLKDGVKEDAQSMKAIGYKEVVEYIKNQISYEEMVELIKKHSRNYAKRQLTFCRGIAGLEFVDVLDRDNAEKIIFEKVEEWLWVILKNMKLN